jgi:hypothetical protein
MGTFYVLGGLDIFNWCQWLKNDLIHRTASAGYVYGFLFGGWNVGYAEGRI